MKVTAYKRNVPDPPITFPFVWTPDGRVFYLRFRFMTDLNLSAQGRLDLIDSSTSDETCWRRRADITITNARE